MGKIKYGDVVTVAGSYRRITIYGYSQDGRFQRGTRKEWQFVPGEITGIFLGGRTLANGRREHDPEYGYEFIPTEHFKVLLISPSDRKNPIYASITNPELTNEKTN